MRFNFTILFVILFYQCSDIKENTIQKSYQEIPSSTESLAYGQIFLSEFLDVEAIIPLQQTNEFILDFPLQVLVSDKRVFVANTQYGVGEFDFEGNFLRRYGGYGNGPGEFNDLSTFDVNLGSQQMFLVDNARKQILVFDLDGTFMKSIDIKLDLEVFRVISIKSMGINDFLVTITTNTINNKVAYVLRMNDKGVIIDEFLNDEITISNFSNTETLQRRPDDSYFIYSTFSNKIYAYNSKGEISKYLEIDSKHPFSKEKLEKAVFDEMITNRNKLIAQSEYKGVNRINSFYDFGNYLYLSYIYDHTTINSLIIRKNDQEIKKGFLNDDLTNQVAGEANLNLIRYAGPDYFYFATVNFDTTQIDKLLALDLEEDVRMKLENREISDNPVIILYKNKQ